MRFRFSRSRIRRKFEFPYAFLVLSALLGTAGAISLSQSLAQPPKVPTENHATALQNYANELQELIRSLPAADAQSIESRLNHLPKEFRSWEYQYALDRVAQAKSASNSELNSSGFRRASPPQLKQTRGYLHPNGLQVVFACGDGSLRVTDRLLEKSEFKVADPWNEPVVSISFSQSGDFCATGTIHGHITIYQTKDWSVLKQMDPSQDPLFQQATAPPKPDKAGSVDAKDEVQKALETALQNAGPRAAVVSLAISPDGKRMLFHRTKFAFLWDVEANQCIAQLSNVGFMEPGPLEFSADGSIAYSGGLLPIHLYDAHSGTHQRELLHSTHPMHLSLSRDRRWMASGTRGNITRDFRLFDATNGKELFTTGQQKEAVTGVAFLGASDRVAVLEKAGRLRIYQAPTGVVMLEWNLGGASGQLQTSEDGSILLWTRLAGKEYVTEYIEVGLAHSS